MLEVLPLAGRVLLGAVLLVAGIAKLRDRSGFAASIRAFGFVPPSLSRPTAAILPVIELGCGVSLLIGFAVPVAAAAATGLLVIFSVGIAGNLRRGRTAPCACFGAGTARRLGPSALVRNLLLLAAGVAVFTGTAAAGSTPNGMDYLAAVLLAGMLAAVWQLLLTTNAVLAPAQTLMAEGNR